MGSRLVRKFYQVFWLSIWTYEFVSLQETAIDYNKHAHARYRVCKQGDKLEFGSFEPSRWEVPLHETSQMFSKKDSFESCQDRSLFEVSYQAEQ